MHNAPNYIVNRAKLSLQGHFWKLNWVGFTVLIASVGSSAASWMSPGFNLAYLAPLVAFGTAMIAIPNAFPEEIVSLRWRAAYDSDARARMAIIDESLLSFGTGSRYAFGWYAGVFCLPIPFVITMSKLLGILAASWS